MSNSYKWTNKQSGVKLLCVTQAVESIATVKRCSIFAYVSVSCSFGIFLFRLLTNSTMVTTTMAMRIAPPTPTVTPMMTFSCTHSPPIIKYLVSQLQKQSLHSHFETRNTDHQRRLAIIDIRPSDSAKFDYGRTQIYYYLFQVPKPTVFISLNSIP